MSDQPNDRGATQDPIVAEVRAARTKLFAEAGNDIREFCRRARERQRSSGHTIVDVHLGGPDLSGADERSVRPSRHTG
jgi:hypothetical protein